MNKIILSAIFCVSMIYAQTDKYMSDPTGQLSSDPTLSSLPDQAGLHAGAKKGLKVMGSIARQENNKEMFNVATASDMDKAVLNRPVREYFVRADSLATFQLGQNPEKLLVDAEIVNYPVAIGEDIKGEITMAKQNNQWEPVSIGTSQRMNQRMAAYKNSVRNLNTLNLGHFIVRVPALNMEFIGYRSKNVPLQLTPLFSDNKLQLDVGVTYPAVNVFAWLAPEAAKVKDDRPPQ